MSTHRMVFVGMSGGVDSSAAAFLLKKKGYNVVGVFMRCYNIDGCAERDAEDARRVAEHIGISFYVWDFEEEYKRKVVEYMIDGYRAGITPNPDVMCNKEIKFGLFLEKALAAGADYVATGHYVRLKKIKKHYALFAAKDKDKDQSYFLWTLTQAQLTHCLFPIGDYVKPEVRAIARKAGLPTAKKKDSQGICFLGNVNIGDFLKQYIPERRGALVTTSGETIGEHSGAEFYTIGQRHIQANFQFPISKSKIKGKNDRARFYVASKDMEANIIVVAEGGDNPALLRSEIKLADTHFINQNPFAASGKTEMKVHARVRYRQLLFPATLNTLSLIFDRPQKFIASGQSVVFYTKQGEMLGGGIIV